MYGVLEGINTLVVAFGINEQDQLEEVFQSVFVVPIQVPGAK
jgi:hypothetical protein